MLKGNQTVNKLKLYMDTVKVVLAELNALKDNLAGV